MYLNSFQRWMRCCSELTPYNLTHAMRLAGTPDQPSLQDAIRHIVKELGLGAPTFDRNSISARPLPGVVLRLVDGDIEEYVAAEMNRAFRYDEMPIRFLVVRESDTTHWFGLVADHWVADHHSARELMRRVFEWPREREVDRKARKSALQPKRASISPVAIVKGLASVLRQWTALRSAFRVPLGDPLDFRVGCFRRRFPDGLIEELRRRARQYEATVHDLFLAATAQTLGEFRRECVGGRRLDVAVGTPVSLRREDHTLTGTAEIGCMLSQFTVTIARPEDRAAADLIPAIASTTKRAKADPGSQLAVLDATRILWRLSRTDRAKATLFHRVAPIACGISNVNLTGTWIDSAHPRLLEYRRYAPAGPITPIVFAITTIGSQLALDVTYRCTAFSESAAESVAQAFMSRLQAL